MSNKILLIALFFCISCIHDNSFTKSKQDVLPEDSAGNIELDPLTEGDLEFSEESFGKVIELAGESHPVDQLFEVKEVEMLSINDFLIIKNLNMNNGDLFYIYSLPEWKFIKSFGSRGKGPDEFGNPHIVPNFEDEPLCYIYDMYSDDLYSLDQDLNINVFHNSLPESEARYSGRQLISMSDSNFVYVQSTEDGKAIYQTTFMNDSLSNELIYDLSFSSKYKNWSNYIGDFGASKKNNRLVFAYKYFKRLLFIDTKTGKKRTITFIEEKSPNGDERATNMDSRITHYWGMSARENYIYVLYSGRVPYDVAKELRASSGYIYVEQFDWNGNPIHKFRLDHWGYFCVSEDETMIYLISVTDENPFYSYIIPDLSENLSGN